MRRILGVAALLGVALVIILPGLSLAAPPNRVFGTVTLNGQPAPSGTVIQALTAGKVCGTTTVSQLAVNEANRTFPYLFSVLPEGTAPDDCKPGAVITFTVGGVTAAQTITLNDLGEFFRVDLTAPGTPNVPASASRIVTLAAGCTDVAAAFPDGTPAQTVAAAISPPGALAAVWRYDVASGSFHGYSPAIAFASDLVTINRNDALRICTSAAATLTQPA